MTVQYFKIGTGRFIQYDDATNRAVIILKDDLVEEQKALIERIKAADPNQPKSDKEWIAWARANYPYVDHSAEEMRLAVVNEIIEAVKGL